GCVECVREGGAIAWARGLDIPINELADCRTPWPSIALAIVGPTNRRGVAALVVDVLGPIGADPVSERIDWVCLMNRYLICSPAYTFDDGRMNGLGLRVTRRPRPTVSALLLVLRLTGVGLSVAEVVNGRLLT